MSLTITNTQKPAIDIKCLLQVIERDGYTIVPDVVESETIQAILGELENVSERAVLSRAGKAFGIRNLLGVLPAARILAQEARLRLLIEPVLGSKAKVVRGIYFDKNREANWKVAWHQDVTIAVQQQRAINGYGAWSVKAGITHVQPPVKVLENMLALRLHLDDTDESNGALHVLPGSHKHGRLTATAIQAWKKEHEMVTCPVPKGGAMLMRPLLLHASSAASTPKHRRVLHFEYASFQLPHGLSWYDHSDIPENITQQKRC